MRNTILSNIKNTETDFIKCGVVGWCLEVIWTGIDNLRNRDMKMTSKTSLLMFPIYGLGFFIKPFHYLIRNRNFIIRGSIYTGLIFMAEYLCGTFLKKKKMCPWDYSKSRFNIKGVIRLDYAPAWFFVGLLYEKLLNTKNSYKL